MIRCAFAGALLLSASRAPAATPAEVDAAIAGGIRFLYSVQSEDGNWDFILKPDANGKFSGDTKQAGGPTALAVYALLTAGESPTDPRIVKAVDWLKKVQTSGTYAIGFRANAYALMPPSADMKRALAGDAGWIKNSVRLGKEVKLRGFYGYGSNPKSGNDRSTSQVAVLGAWGCAQISDSFGEDYWKLIENAWLKAQLEDGGWNYSEGINPQSSMAMTASGIATLFITQEYLHINDFSACTGSANSVALEKGLKWMGEHFQGGFAQWPYYTLFAIERCGAASGYKFFGETDWFTNGADWLIKEQNKETGAWDGANNPSTSFALLFLGRGRAPVAVIKLEYKAADVAENANVNSPTGSNWNQRPRDVPNICRWTGRQQERTLNFQIAGIDAPLESLQDAPILYIAGNQPLKLTDEKTAKLKKFIEDGGMIVGNADCANKLFVESFKKLGEKMFPTYEFRVPPTDHPMFGQFPAAAWKTPPSLLSLGNGSREFMLLFAAGDPAKYWQLHMFSGHEVMHQVMADVLGYAIEPGTVRRKGESHVVKLDKEVPTERTMKLARLQYPGNWDPEPGSWRRMAALLHNQQRIDLTVEPVNLGDGKLDNTYPLAHLTGTTAYKLTDNAVAELKKYVEGGGTILIDACGGSGEFATDMEAQLSTIFGGGKNPEVLPLTHKIFATDFTSFQPKITEVDYRAHARKVLGLALKTPQLRGIEVGGRTAVLFSREDLSSGMVGEPIGGIIGYAPKSATAIVQHILGSVAPPKPEVKPETPPGEKPAETPAPKPPEPAPAAPAAPAAAPAEKPAEAPAPDPGARRRAR
jgi:hypothetical protein